MANRKATFAKRQRETELKDRAKQKTERREQKRGEVREVKGPQIAWDEAVYATTDSELPELGTANQQRPPQDDDDGGSARPGPDAAPTNPPAAGAPSTPTRLG